MQWDAGTARQHFLTGRVARLATVGADAAPHLVPIVFALSDEDVLYFAVDAKPKRTTALRRLDNIAANPQVSVLVDYYAEDWRQLWWARADGAARVLDGTDAPGARALLAARYEQYRATPPPGPVVAIDVRRWTGWSGAS